ncbi:MAG: hypothetical protein R3C26_12075 [Calditrichia bacterium]
MNIRELQQTLLDAGCWLMPFAEISPNEKSFQAIQRIGLCGWMTGFPLPIRLGKPAAVRSRKTGFTG